LQLIMPWRPWFAGLVDRPICHFHDGHVQQMHSVLQFQRASLTEALLQIID
jgi:hypothetical protein